MSTEATITITVQWLCKHRPVAFTNRTKDQPRMADPFPIYQQVVKDNEAFFRDVHGYVPLPNSKTGLAGVMPVTDCMGFEPRSARIGYVYNPDRNPNLLDMPSSESDQDASRLLWEEDLRDDELENEYFTALQAHLEALNATLDATVSPAEKTQKRKEYTCSRCVGVPKKGTSARRLLRPRSGKVRRLGRV